ncbi:MAG: multiheme c-type cytochrome [Thermoleophilia bacterium]
MGGVVVFEASSLRRADRSAWGLVALLCVTAFVLFLLGAPPAAQAADGDPICVSCHTSVSLDVVETWRSQNHGRNGVTCEKCHGTHDSDFTPKPTVQVCVGCHDVASIHEGFLPETPAARCMDCHTSNVHLLPGQASWFYSGLPPDKLAGEDGGGQGGIAGSTGRGAGVIGAAVAVVLGLLFGLVLDRFVRSL